MLNIPLYNALVRLFGDVAVIHEDEQGQYEVPQITHSIADRARKNNDVYAHVTSWGECYKLNCPVCGDTKGRLYICHLWGKHIFRGKNPRWRVKFGKRVYVCHNEHCNIDKYLCKLQIDKKEKIPKGYHSTYVGPKLKPGKARKSVMQQIVDLPEPCVSLLSDDVPENALTYLLGRGFIPGGENGIATKYNLYFAPKGAKYKDGDEEKEFYESRLVIPVINRNRLAFWQARSFREKAKLKYINTPGLPKSFFLYNMDAAWQYRDVILVEGVTDVWRIGENAICPFGKTLSAQQIQIMKILWGHCGRLLIVLDRDARVSERDYAKDMKNQLEKAEAFPRGVHLYELPDNRDPADYETRDIRIMLQNVFLTLDQQHAAERAHNLVAKGLPVFEAMLSKDFE